MLGKLPGFPQRFGEEPIWYNFYVFMLNPTQAVLTGLEVDYANPNPGSVDWFRGRLYPTQAVLTGLSTPGSVDWVRGRLDDAWLSQE